MRDFIHYLKIRWILAAHEERRELRRFHRRVLIRRRKVQKEAEWLSAALAEARVKARHSIRLNASLVDSDPRLIRVVAEVMDDVWRYKNIPREELVRQMSENLYTQIDECVTRGGPNSARGIRAGG